MKKKNVALFDSTAEEAEDFICGLENATKASWEVKVLTANQGREKRIANLIRYIKYFFFPFQIFLNRKKYDCIVGWQAFYGLLFAFYCRLFHVKKVNRVLVKNLIYKPKKGIIGKWYFAFMRYIVKSKYVDLFVCSSEKYCDYCAQIFDEPRERFIFLHFGVNDFTKMMDMNKPVTNDYILALGRSNRDWDFLIDSLSGTEYKLRIVCDELHREQLPENIEIYNNVWQEASYEFIRNCKAMVISILDGKIVAGETVLLQAMSFSKPIIITKPSCLAEDYVTDGKTGLVIPKEKDALLEAIKRLYEDAELYTSISHNCRKLYEDKHSLYSFGVNVGNALITHHCLEIKEGEN